MPPTKYDESSNPNSESDRVQEGAVLFDLPNFESRPATDGLSNLQAFQLSLRHALALLPALFARGEVGRDGEEEADRFTLI